MRLATVMVKEHTRRAVQLRHDYAFRAIDDEGSIARHQRQLTHEHFLFLDVLYHLVACRRCLVINDQTRKHSQRRCESQATDLALTFVERGFAKAVADVMQLDVA